MARKAKDVFDPKKTYYCLEPFHFYKVGEKVDLTPYSDKKNQDRIDAGVMGTEKPEVEEETDAEEPVDAADASLPEERRSGEATGQPDPDAPDQQRGNIEGTGETRGRPKNS